MYFQYLGKKKQDEEAWKALHQEDMSRYKKLRAKYILAPEEKTAHVLLEEDEGPILEKRLVALGAYPSSTTGADEPKIKLKIIRKEEKNDPEVPLPQKKEIVPAKPKLAKGPLVDYEDSDTSA